MNNITESRIVKKIESKVDMASRRLKDDMQKDDVYRQLLAEKVFRDVEPLAGLTSWAVAPEMAWWLYKQVVDKKFNTIVELGSGFSTLVLAKGIQANGRGRLLSFEHDYQFYCKTKKNLQELGLEEQVHLVYSPLRKREVDDQLYQWYDISKSFLDNSFAYDNVDFLIIDGPPASTGKYARYPAYPVFMPYLKPKARIVLDDGGREDEKEIVSRWLDNNGARNDLRLMNDIRHAPLVFTHGMECKSLSPDEGDIQTLVRSVLLKIKEQVDHLPAENDDSSFALEEIIQHAVDQIAVSLESHQDSWKRKAVEAEAEAETEARKSIENFRLSMLDDKENMARLEKDIQSLKKKEIALKQQVKRLMLEKQELKSRSSFQIGSAIARNLGGPKKWIRMPSDIYQTAISYKSSKNKRQSILDSIADLDDEDAWSLPDTLLFEAASRIEINGYNWVVKFIKKNATKESDIIGARLIEANNDLGNDVKWLSVVNDYLALNEMAPVTLNQSSSSPRFFQLASAVESGSCEGPLISVIMPAYNAEETLRFAAESILQQTWRNLELIIVDDCSQDATWGICQELAQQDSRVSVLRNHLNAGPYVSKNRGLDLAGGQYITGHDADDWAHPQRLEDQLTRMKASGAMASLAHMVRFKPDGAYSYFSKCGRTSPDGIKRIASISLMIERNVMVEKLGYWDSVRFGADSELIARARMVLDDRLIEIRTISMLCLDLESSLTNNSLYGINHVGVSAPRIAYRESYSGWHAKLSGDNVYLPFPHFDRYFPAPQEAKVSHETLIELSSPK